MEITRTNMKVWSYTIKKVSGGSYSVLPEDYESWFQRLTKYNIEVEYKVPEKDKTGRLHYHGILYTKKGFWMKKLTSRMRGYTIYFKEVFHRKGWEKYIHKDCDEYINMPKEPPSPDFRMPSKSLFK